MGLALLNAPMGTTTASATTHARSAVIRAVSNAQPKPTVSSVPMAPIYLTLNA